MLLLLEVVGFRIFRVLGGWVLGLLALFAGRVKGRCVERNLGFGVQVLSLQLATTTTATPRANRNICSNFSGTV